MIGLALYGTGSSLAQSHETDLPLKRADYTMASVINIQYGMSIFPFFDKSMPLRRF